jgi:predicted amidophosphoribosyltransferase
LHPQRLRERGFNQALELARPVARALDVPLAATLARRVLATTEQASLTAQERRRNVADAFRIDRDLTGQRVAVVDDVMTTGSTVGALAGALRNAGARHIQVWVCARALAPR